MSYNPEKSQGIYWSIENWNKGTKKQITENLERLKLLKSPDAERLKWEMDEVLKLAQWEQEDALESLNQEVAHQLKDAYRNLVKEIINKSDLKSFEEVYLQFGPLIGSKENLRALMSGQMLAELQSLEGKPDEQVNVLKRFAELGIQTSEIYFANVAKTEIPNDSALANLNNQVLMREMTFNQFEEDSIDQIVMARHFIAKDAKDNNLEKYDPRLRNILQIWIKRDIEGAKNLTVIEKQTLANLLSVQIKDKEVEKYLKQRSLRNMEGNLKEEAYQHALQSIAQEVYAWNSQKPADKVTGLTISKSPTQNEIDDLVEQLKTNPHLIEKVQVDSRSDRQRKREDAPGAFLDPANLLKLIVTVWGGALATLNLIAFKWDVLDNEYFWIGASAATVGGMELHWNKILTWQEIHNWKHKVDDSQKERPFKRAKEIEGKKIENLSLNEYIQRNPEEIKFLQQKLSHTPKLSMLIQQTAVNAVIFNQEKSETYPVITKNNLENNTRDVPTDIDEIRNGYQRSLFYKNLKSNGIENLSALNTFLAVDNMLNGTNHNTDVILPKNETIAWETTGGFSILASTDNRSRGLNIQWRKWVEQRSDYVLGLDKLLASNRSNPYKKYLWDLENVSQKHNVPVDLMLRLMILEGSGGNPRTMAKGSTAIGLGQMINDTWKTYKPKEATSEGDRFNPKYQIDAMANYLAQIKRNQNCTWGEALVYYHTGEWIMNLSNAEIKEYLAVNPAIKSTMQELGLKETNARNYVTAADYFYNKTKIDG